MIKLILIIISLLLFSIYTLIDILISFILEKIFKFNLRNYNNKVVNFILKCFIFISGAKIEIYGKENIINDKPCFIIANHRGFFDVIIGKTIINQNCGFIAKKELGKMPILYYWMKKIDCFFLDRDNLRSGAKMIIDAISKINNGISIWLFPEGERNKNEDAKQLLQFKSGAFKIPEKTDCYIIPIAFIGTDNIFEKNFPKIKKSIVKINIGKPYKISEMNCNDTESIAEKSRNIIINLIEEMIKR